MEVKDKEIERKQSKKSSSLISSSSSSSSDSSGSQGKYQKKQLQLSKDKKNDKQLSRKDSKKQKNYSSRSRSNSSQQNYRSRSHKKQKQKHNKQKNVPKHHSRRSRSRQTHYTSSYRSKSSRDRDRKNKYRNDRESRDYNNNGSRRYRDQRDRDRKNKKDHRDRDGSKRYDDRRDRDRDRQRRENRGRSRDNKQLQKQKSKKQQLSNNKLLPIQIPMPAIQVAMPLMPGQRRKRQRSRSPLDYYRRNQNNNQGQFWDSFSWVPRINYTPNVSSSALANTKKMRRLMITNIPYEMGITKDDLRDLITKFMTVNYLKDSMNNCPVRDLQLNEQDHNVSVELSSVEQTCRMCKLEKIQLLKGTINGIIRLGDSCYGNNIVTQAQNAAQAQAAAFAAITVLQNKKTNFNMDVNLSKGTQVSTLIRVTNAVTAYMAAHLTLEQWQQYHQDLIQGLSQFGKIVHNWFVKADEKQICADPGNLFIEYQSQQQAMKAMEQMQGRMYDQRVIKLFYVSRDIYYPNFKKDITPPTIKAPPKPQKQNPFSNLPQISKSSHIASKAAN